MMPVSALLRDFSERPPEPAGISSEAVAEMSAQLVEAAREEGRLAGMEEAQAQADARLAQREAEFAAQLRGQREAWCASESAVLAEAITKGLEGLHDAVMAQVAQTLKPFLVEEVRQKALAELAIAVGAMLAKEPDVGLEVVGPSDLVKALEGKLTAHAGSISYASASFCEVEVKAGSSVIATRIGAWLDKINEACP